MTKWLRVAFDGAKTHCVPQELLPDLVQEMISRDHPLTDFEAKNGLEHNLGDNPKLVTEWALDLGGMWAVGQPVSDVVLDELGLSIPDDHMNAILTRLGKCEERSFGALKYHKFHSWNSCLVMTPEHIEQLITKLASLAPAAEERAEGFFTALTEQLRDKFKPTAAQVVDKGSGSN